MKYVDTVQYLERQGYRIKRVEGDPYIQVHCPQGHDSKSHVKVFVTYFWKHGCGDCKHRKFRDTVRQFYASWASEGFTDFRREKRFLFFKCPKGHQVRRTWLTALRSKSLCTSCEAVRVEEAFQVKKKQLEAKGYRVESLPGKALVRCPAGHLTEKSRSNVIEGKGCGVCNGKDKNYYWKELKQKIESEGWEVLSPEYINNRLPLQLKNPAGDTYYITAEGWNRGYRTNFIPISIEDIRPFFTAEGYEILDTKYEGAIQKIRVRCPGAHELAVSWNHWSASGVRCQKCNPQSSKMEIAFLAEVQKLYPDAAKHRIDGVEFDIWIPSQRMAIEICGILYHSEAVLHRLDKEMDPSKREIKLERLKTQHRSKFLHAQKKGFRLFTVFEDEIWNKKEVVLRRILRRTKIIAARDCEFKILSREEAVSFLETNHLQGSSSRSSHFFGLKHEGQLVGVMTFGPHPRKPSSAEIVLDRLCFGECGVTGGSEKLFTNSLKILPYSKICSWSDNRYAEGGVYERLGFRKEADLPPDYSYCNPSRRKRVSKQSLKKTPEERLTGMPEHKLRHAQGWYRIWDCGKIRWIYERS